MSIDELIKTMRTRAGFSAARLADELGCAIQSVYNWEHGDTLPNAETLLSIARICGYELIFRPKPRSFYGGEE